MPTPKSKSNLQAVNASKTAWRLDEHSSLYSQIKEILKARILEGVLTANQRMPSESELMSAFGVSRITVRHAMAALQSEGLIYSVHGKGTFVSRPRAFQDLGSLRGFGSAMRQMGYETHSRVLSMKAMRPAQEILEILKLDKGSKVNELRRLRFLNREPISVDISYLPGELGERLAKEDLANRDVFSILENNFQIPLGHADLEINSLILEDESLAETLRVDLGSPILYIERTIHTAQGEPLEFEKLYYRGDAFKFKVRVGTSTQIPI